VSKVDMKKQPYLAKDRIFKTLHPTFIPRPKAPAAPATKMAPAAKTAPAVKPAPAVKAAPGKASDSK
jgi:hypothetical protein